MKLLEKKMSQMKELFKEGKPLSKFFPLFEAMDTFLLTPGKVTKKAPYARDAIDMKRVMMFVVIGLLPCLFMGVYNTGYQILVAQGLPVVFLQCLWLGALKVVPIILVTYAAGGFWEVLFAIVRRHEISEGFLVTGMLFALIMPPTIPLWQVAAGISFGVVIGKEIFGGVGMNVLNPALVGRAFLFFSYPIQFSGDLVWVAVDGYTKATPLAILMTAEKGTSAIPTLLNHGFSLKQMFYGFIPGAIGETSTLACLLGLAFLLITRVASWRIILGCLLGAVGMSSLLFLFRGEHSLVFFSVPPHWHIVMGSFAFGSIFMATDPVSAAATDLGRWVYGVMIGVLVILIRTFNPAYTEGTMLSILFMNVFAPLIDHFVVEQNIRKRLKRVK